MSRLVDGVKDSEDVENIIESSYWFSIFDKEGNLLPILPKFLTEQLRNKICVQNLILAHFVNDHPVMEQEMKEKILQHLDEIYKSGKKMHNKLREYRRKELGDDSV